MIRPRHYWRGGGISGALLRLEKKASLRSREMREAMWKTLLRMRENIAREVESKTGLPYKEGVRRMRAFRSRSPINVFVGLRISENASTIHAGRIKGIRSRKGKIKSVPGVGEINGFLYGKNKYRGRKRRVYQRLYSPQRIEAVNHPHRVSKSMVTYMRRRGITLVRRAMLRVRAKQAAEARRML